VVSVGIRPCSGAVTVAVLATLALGARELALKLGGGRSDSTP
jgi:ABC-type nickel/cobalt efflux system permease component RcnA